MYHGPAAQSFNDDGEIDFDDVQHVQNWLAFSSPFTVTLELVKVEPNLVNSKPGSWGCKHGKYVQIFVISTRSMNNIGNTLFE